MKKSIVLPVLAGIMVLSVWGCENKEQEKVEADTGIEAAADQKKEHPKESQEKEGQKRNQNKKEQQEEGQENGSGLSFKDFRNVEFVFCSGVGGWQTSLTIGEDGSFSGLFFDGNMGDIGEGYPNGSILWSEFSGRFTPPVQEDANTYSVQIEALEYKEQIGTEEIQDEMRYCYTDAYGLDGTKTIRIHVPGAPLEQISEEARNWIGYYDLSQTTDTTLSFYVLENEQQGYGFRGFDMVEELRKTIVYTERQVAEQEESIQKEMLSQTELTEKTGYIYNLWDQALNSTWDVLKKTLDAETMEALTVEERRWIDQKEAAVIEAGAEFEGGSLQPMAMNDMAAKLTKARVYELLEWLE